MMKEMEDMKDKKGYIPTLNNYKPIESDYLGYFSVGGRDNDMTNAEIAQVDSFLQMCDLSHKTFLYSEEKKENFIKNNLEQKSLR